MDYRLDPTRRLFVLGATASAAALAVGLPALAWADDLPSFAKAEIKTEATAMLKKHGVESEKSADILRKVGKVLGSKQWGRMEEKGVHGVGAFRMGGGGLILKITKGDGVMSFPAGKDVNFALKSAGVGAHIGGAGVWGVILLVGLGVKKGFGGAYKGGDTGATFAEESTALNIMSHRGDAAHEHNAYLITSSAGAQATAGTSKLTISPRW